MTIVTQTRGLWRRQPFDGPLEVDWSNPLARNLEFAFSGHQHREAVRGRFATITGSVTRDVSERGRHFEFAGTTTTSSAHMGFGSSTLSGLAGNSRPATWAFLVRVDTTTRVNLAECNDGNAVDTGWIVGHITGGFGITRECASSNHRVYTTSNPAAGWRTIVLTTDGSIIGTTGKAVWYDGVSQSMTLGANGAGVQGSSAQTLTLGRAGFDTGAGCLDGGIAVALIAERQWGEAEVKAFHDNPWAIFRRRVLRVYGLDAASGTIYAGSLSESLTLTESLSGVSVLGGGLADSLAVTDTASGAAVLGGALSESASLTDAASGARTGAGSLAETLTLTDSASGAAVLGGSVVESATVTDATGGGLVAGGALSESLAITDATSGAAVLGGTIAESAPVTDALSGELDGDLAGSIAETLSITDSLGGVVIAGGAVAESMALADSVGAIRVGLGSVAESLAVTDAVDATRFGLGSVAETLSLADVLGGARAFSGSIAETLVLVDTVSSPTDVIYASAGRRGGVGVQVQGASRRNVQTATRTN